MTDYLRTTAVQVVMTHGDNNELIRSALKLIKPMDQLPSVAVYGPTWIRNSAVIELHLISSNNLALIEQFEELIDELCASGTARWSSLSVREEVTA